MTVTVARQDLPQKIPFHNLVTPRSMSSSNILQEQPTSEGNGNANPTIHNNERENNRTTRHTTATVRLVPYRDVAYLLREENPNRLNEYRRSQFRKGKRLYPEAFNFYRTAFVLYSLVLAISLLIFCVSAYLQTENLGAIESVLCYFGAVLKMVEIRLSIIVKDLFHVNFFQFGYYVILRQDFS